MNITINISTDKQICGQCKKPKKGCYKTKDGRWICHNCVMSNIKRTR
jgi:hypothetical protein